MNYEDKVLSETLGELAERAKQLESRITVELITDSNTDAILGEIGTTLGNVTTTLESFDTLRKKRALVKGRVDSLTRVMVSLPKCQTSYEQDKQDCIVMILERISSIRAEIPKLDLENLDARQTLNMTHVVVRILDMLLETLDSIDQVLKDW